MAIKISVSDIVGIKIEATINDETGAAKPDQTLNQVQTGQTLRIWSHLHPLLQ